MSQRRGRTGSDGRFGARYGRVARRRVAEIEAEMGEDHVCPECGQARVDRQGTGIWECGGCGYTYTGGAYTPETPGGKTVRRSIRAALAEEDDVAEAGDLTADPDVPADADGADVTDEAEVADAEATAVEADVSDEDDE